MLHAETANGYVEVYSDDEASLSTLAKALQGVLTLCKTAVVSIDDELRNLNVAVELSESGTYRVVVLFGKMTTETILADCRGQRLTQIDANKTTVKYLVDPEGRALIQEIESHCRVVRRLIREFQSYRGQ